MTTATLDAAPGVTAPPPPRSPRPPGRTAHRRGPARHTVQHIQGRFRPITAGLLAAAAWLYATNRITRRQLRVYLAAHEMAERRRYAKRETAKERPVYRLEELAALVGGQGSPSALRALSADVSALARTGLVVIEDHAIRFGKSPRALAVGEGCGAELEAFLGKLPSLERAVPVPRRLLRALAGGFGRAETLYVLAFLVRAVFWKKREGHITVDGRMKGSWVAETFALSRRAVTGARQRLIELGWIRPLEVHQRLASHGLLRGPRRRERGLEPGGGRSRGSGRGAWVRRRGRGGRRRPGSGGRRCGRRSGPSSGRGSGLRSCGELRRGGGGECRWIC